jgi:hypothetical protein
MAEYVMDNAILESVLTCPYCGWRRQETMPTDACQFFYECKGCGAVLRPEAGDCCVFCSYGTVKCPPVQLQRGCCGKTKAGVDE